MIPSTSAEDSCHLWPPSVSEQPKLERKATIIPFEQLRPIEEDSTTLKLSVKVALVDFERKKLQLRPMAHGTLPQFNTTPGNRRPSVETRYKLMRGYMQVKYNVNGDIAEIIDADGIEELELGR